MSKPSIPTCCVTGAIPGDGGACGDCDPCIMGEPLVPEAVKRLIAEKNSQISHAADLAGELDASLSREAALREALKAIVHGRDAEDFFIGSSGMVEIARAALKSPAA